MPLDIQAVKVLEKPAKVQTRVYLAAIGWLVYF